MLLFELCSFALYVVTSIHADEIALLSGNGNNTGTSVGSNNGPVAVTEPAIVAANNAKPLESILSFARTGAKKDDTPSDSSIVKFTCVKDGQVMTLDGDQPTPGLKIMGTFWNNSDSQKWLLIQRGDVYLILPRKQHKEWANFLKRTSQRGSDNLPSITSVVGIDVQNGDITQQVLHGRSNQHWEFRDAKEGRILITSPARGKCIQEKPPAVTEKPSILQRAGAKIKGVFGSKPKPEANIVPVQLVAADCDEADLSQLWRLEPVLR